MRVSRLLLGCLFLTAACSDGGHQTARHDGGSQDEDAEASPDGADEGDGEADAEQASDGGAAALDGATDLDAAGADADAPSDAQPPRSTLAQIPGDSAARARTSVPSVGPVIASIDDNDRDGFLHTRLLAAFAPGATVAAVNAALAGANATLACARPGQWSLSLAVPAQPDVAAARALAAQLMSSGAFSFVEPAWGEVSRQQVPPEAPTLKAGDVSNHLRPPGFLAAWNASKAAFDRNARTLVLVPDTYLETTPDPRIGGQRFGKARYDYPGLDANGGVKGNHGFWTSGLVAAKLDDDPFSGTSPGPERLLDVLSVQLALGDWAAKVAAIEEELPSEGKFIVSLSQGYNDPRFAEMPRFDRVVLALDWRIKLARHHTRALIAASAGNDGLSGADPGTTWNSPFTTQHSMDDLRQLLSGDDATRFASIWSESLADQPELASERAQTISVGSSNAKGVRSAFTCKGEEIRMVAEPAVGLCRATTTSRSQGSESDALCDGATLTFRAEGTSGAAPQLAGLLAYMWNLAPSATPKQLRDLLFESTTTARWADAYAAVLSLELAPLAAPVRAAILDVRGDGDLPDGKFDERDVEAFVSAILAGNELSSDPKNATQDFTRFDLNGDGFTRSDTAAPFDLDFAAPWQLTNVAYTEGSGASARALTLDENAVTDMDVLCYYAWSDRYTGSAEARESALDGRCESKVQPGVRKAFQGDVTVQTRRSYAFSSLNTLGGSGGVYPSLSTTNLVYKVECPYSDKGPGTCKVVSAQGSVSESITTTKPATRERGIGTSCHFMEFLSRQEAVTGSGSIGSPEQQSVVFHHSTTPGDTTLGMTLNVFGLNTPIMVHDSSTINVLFGEPNCAGPGLDESSSDGVASPGRLNRRFNNIGNEPGAGATTFSGSFNVAGTIPATAIESPANESTIEVSWSLRVVQL